MRANTSWIYRKLELICPVWPSIGVDIHPGEDATFASSRHPGLDERLTPRRHIWTVFFGTGYFIWSTWESLFVTLWFRRSSTDAPRSSAFRYVHFAILRVNILQYRKISSYIEMIWFRMIWFLLIVKINVLTIISFA